MKKNGIIAVILLAALFIPVLLHAADGVTVPNLNLGVKQTSNPQEVVGALQVLFILTILALAPSIMVMVTAFTRVVIVLGFLRQALGTQQMPPMQVLTALAIFLTFFIMSPTLDKMNQQALVPYKNGSITFSQALTNAEGPLREFMFKQTREKDLSLFISLTKGVKPKNKDEVPTRALIPAFMISELKTAFQIGFILFIPFVIIDMVVSSILLSMGMMMLPPVMISLPFKIMLFVLVDGWTLLVGSIVKGFVG
jgi:flagellar biosynthetic protein FliP